MNNKDRVRYGQIVVGPPGSGKTTFCNGMQQYLNAIGRHCLVVNLDPANENLKDRESNYDTVLDVATEVISASNVMEELDLGPNGALLYGMEYLEKHFDEVLEDMIIKRLEEIENGLEVENKSNCGIYLLFDVPGQVEVFTHCTFISSIVAKLTLRNVRLCSVQLIDAHHCVDPYKFIGSALLAMTTMIRLELPAVNVLSKIDLLKKNETILPFNLDYFTDVMDLTRLLDFIDGWDMDVSLKSSHAEWMDDPEYQAARNKVRNGKFAQKHRKLQEQLCEVIDDFSLVSFLPLDIEDAESVGRVVAKVDKCNGYVFGLSELKDSGSKSVSNLFKCASQELDGEWAFERSMSVQEKYLPHLFGEGATEENGDLS